MVYHGAEVVEDDMAHRDFCSAFSDELGRSATEEMMLTVNLFVFSTKIATVEPNSFGSKELYMPLHGPTLWIFMTYDFYGTLHDRAYKS